MKTKLVMRSAMIISAYIISSNINCMQGKDELMAKISAAEDAYYKAKEKTETDWRTFKKLIATKSESELTILINATSTEVAKAALSEYITLAKNEIAKDQQQFNKDKEYIKEELLEATDAKAFETKVHRLTLRRVHLTELPMPNALEDILADLKKGIIKPAFDGMETKILEMLTWAKENAHNACYAYDMTAYGEISAKYS